MKILVGTDKGNYTFNAASGTVTLSNLGPVELNQLLLITNVSSNEIIYSPIIPGKGGSITSNVITLDFDTTLMNNTDVLQIFINLYEETPVKFTSDSLDAFGSLMVSSPVVIFESNQGVSSDDGTWEYITANGGSSNYVTYSSVQEMVVGTVSGSSVIRQQHGYNYYIPGVSNTILMTATMETGEIGLTQRVGYYDNSDGLYFEQKDGVNYVCLRSNSSGSVVTTSITQSNWNIDKMDGTGESGITVDFTKSQIYTIDYQWLGVGRIRYGFNIDGLHYYIHEINNANIIFTTYMGTPNLPCRYEIFQTSALSGIRTMKAICASIQSNNNTVPKSRQFIATNGSTSKSINSGVRTSLLSLRLSSTISGKLNRVRVIPESVDLITTSNASIYVELVLQKSSLGETNLGGTPTWTSINNSGLEQSVDGTTVTGGSVIWSGYISDRQRATDIVLNSSKDFLVNNYDCSQSDYLHLVCTPLSNAALLGSIKILEVR